MRTEIARPYRVDRELGADGMATVYLGHRIRPARNPRFLCMRQ